MRFATKAVAFLLPFLAASTAHAAVNLCRFIPYLPNSDMPFERSGAGVDTLGCRTEATTTAHLKQWICGTGSEAVGVSLIHLVPENMNIMLFDGAITGLDGFRGCPSAEVSAYRRAVEARRTQPPAFDPGSILVQDRLTIGPYLGVTLTYLDVAGRGTIVTGWPGSAYSAVHGRVTPVSAIEQISFGVTRQDYQSTQVEIAGQNLYTTPAPEIIAALQGRGSTISATTTPNDRHKTTTLTAPVGLDGVTRIEVESLNRHTLAVTYHLEGLTQYTTYASLLDGRYGRSTVSNGTGATNRNCRYRRWVSGAIIIRGEYCPAASAIIFTNQVAELQLFQAAARARRPAQPNRPIIDPDNL